MCLVALSRGDIFSARRGHLMEIKAWLSGLRQYVELSGAPKTNRTSDLPLRRGLLYPLSYRGVGLMIERIVAPLCLRMNRL